MRRELRLREREIANDFLKDVYRGIIYITCIECIHTYKYGIISERAREARQEISTEK